MVAIAKDTADKNWKESLQSKEGRAKMFKQTDKKRKEGYCTIEILKGGEWNS